MKWKEWVIEVERQMENKCLPENPEIYYIDTNMPDNRKNIDVVFTDEDGLTIISMK